MKLTTISGMGELCSFGSAMSHKFCDAVYLPSRMFTDDVQTNDPSYQYHQFTRIQRSFFSGSQFQKEKKYGHCGEFPIPILPSGILKGKKSPILECRSDAQERLPSDSVEGLASPVIIHGVDSFCGYIWDVGIPPTSAPPTEIQTF